MNRLMRAVVMAGVVSVVLVGSGPINAKAAETQRVYYGDSGSFTNPAVVAAGSVFVEIEEYRRIVEERLTPEDPEYWILLGDANEKFYTAVARVAVRHGYDLVAESGTLESDDGEPPDITDKVIAEIKSSQ